MQHTSFWSRVGGWFKNGTRDGDRFSSLDVAQMPQVESDAPEAEEFDPIDSSNASDAIVRAPATKLSRRELTLEKLEQGYNKVVDLIERVEQHLEQQDDRTERMAKGIEDLTASLAHLPESSRTQVEALHAMRDQMGQLPEIADRQRETMTAVSHALDATSRSSEQVAGSLGEVQEAMQELGRTTVASNEALGRLREESQDREERMSSFLQGQTRLLAWFAGIAVSVALLAAALTVAALLK